MEDGDLITRHSSGKKQFSVLQEKKSTPKRALKKLELKTYAHLFEKHIFTSVCHKNMHFKTQHSDLNTN